VVAPTTQPLGRDLPVYEPVRGQPRPTGPDVENPSSDIALRDAVTLALLHSPDLAAFAWESRAREARLVQAGSLPNPVIGILAEDQSANGDLRSGPDGQRVVQPQTTIQLSQVIELGGKRSARLEVATRERDLAMWDYEMARIDVLTRTTHAFVDVLVAQEALMLADRTSQLAEEVEQGVAGRVEGGVVPQIEQTRAAVALAGARVGAARARRALVTARGRLAASWGSTDPIFGAALGDLRIVSEPPPLAALTGGIASTPARARWATVIAQRHGLLALERARRVPDVSVTAGVRRFADYQGNAFLFGASLALPIFDRNRGAVDEADARLAQAYEERRAALTNVSMALAEAYRTLSSAYDELTALREAVLPGAQEAFDAVSEGYRLGKFGYLDVLDAQRTLIGANDQYLRTLAEFHKAAADVERLIGAPLHPANPPAPAEQE
jgi:cobalt-zinc-cadmium efflux system outer membrane protein